MKTIAEFIRFKNVLYEDVEHDENKEATLKVLTCRNLRSM